MDLPTLEYYFYGYIYICTIVRQAMILKRFKNVGQYLHHSDEEYWPKTADNNYDILQGKTALDIINKFKEYYLPVCDLAVDEVLEDLP